MNSITDSEKFDGDPNLPKYCEAFAATAVYKTLMSIGIPGAIALFKEYGQMTAVKEMTMRTVRKDGEAGVFIMDICVNGEPRLRVKTNKARGSVVDLKTGYVYFSIDCMGWGKEQED